MRLGLFGYGTMGRLIRETALAKGHEVTLIIDPSSDAPEVTGGTWPVQAPSVDVMIDFSVPQEVVSHLLMSSEAQIPLVIGTTGWYDQMDEVKKICDSASAGCIWSGNFALGVHLFFRIVEAAGEVMDRFSQYDCMIHEYFHKKKADSPSGTAHMLGTLLLRQLERKTTMVTESLNRSIAPEELHVTSTRGGSIPGTHRVTFDSDVDTISLEHSARTRSGFAEGAVLAAEWIAGKTRFYTIDDMMKTIIEGE